MSASAWHAPHVSDRDADLARLLHAERRLELPALQDALAAARARGLGLAAVLAERGLLSREEAGAWLGRLDPAPPPPAAPAPQVGWAAPAPQVGWAVPEAAPAVGWSAPPVHVGWERDDAETETVTAELVDPAPSAAERLGDYVLLEPLGSGGMGTVWLAQHATTGARYALKVFPKGGDPARAERFRREGQAQARVDAHPNVVTVHHLGEDDERLFLVMDLAPGGDLAERLEAGPLDPREAARCVACLARGLAHVHAAGVLHRDLKPANVLFAGDGRPLLVDFGLARVRGEETLTRTGAVLGTPSYMAPEQARGAPADERTDVYGLGAVLYASLTGRAPFEGARFRVLRAVLRDDPLPPRELAPDVPASLEAVCLRAMAKDPAQRFASAAALAAALDDPSGVEAPPRRAGRRAPRRAAVALGLAVAALLATTLVAPTRGADEARSVADAARWGAAAALDRASWELAARPASFAEAAAELPALRARCAAARAGLPAGVAAPAALARAELRLDALGALGALAAGRAGEAEAALRELAARPGAERALAVVALRGAVAAVTSGDATLAARALDLAGAGGVGAAELARWRARAAARLALDEVRAGRGWRAVERLAAAPAPPPEDAASAALANGVRGALRAWSASFERLGRAEAPPPGDVGEVVALVEVLAALGLPQALARGELDGWLAFALEPTRSISSLAPSLAKLAPDEFVVQVAVARHYNLGRATSASRADPLGGVTRYLHVTRRALALAPDPAARVELGLLLCERLRQADGFAESVRVASELLADERLARAELIGPRRCRLLVERATALLARGRAAEALVDLDAAAREDPSHHDVYVERARACNELALRDPAQERPYYRRALEDAAAYLTRTDPPLIPAHHARWPEAALFAWAACWRTGLAAYYREVRPALELFLRRFEPEGYRSWWLRLAYVHVRCGDLPAARESLTEAVAAARADRRLADLVEPLEEVLRTARRQDDLAGIRAKLLPVLRSLERRRSAGATLP